MRNELMLGLATLDEQIERRGETKGNKPDSERWGAPIELPNTLPAVPPFNPSLLPEKLRPWVMDIANRMQCPADFPAVGALVAASSLIGARAVIQPKEHDDWRVVPNMWGLICGRPGTMKSPALAEVLKPLHRLETDQYERWVAARNAWLLDSKLTVLQSADNEKKAKNLVGKDPAAARALLQAVEVPPEPTLRRHIVNDATFEKLGELMLANPWGVLSYRDELHGLLTMMDKPGQEGARAFYLQGYDGDKDYTFDRIGRGTVRIKRVCLAMLGGIQPGRVQEYVRGAVSGGRADDGLLQRFGLAVWPDTKGQFRNVDQLPDIAAREDAWRIYERLADLDHDPNDEPEIWRFSPEAQLLFNEWRVDLEQELLRGDLHPALESHLAKYRKLIPALALIFAKIDTPGSGLVIGQAELLRAIAWGVHLRGHATRLYAAAATPETAGAALLLKKILAGQLGTTFTPRQVAQKCWTGMATPDVVNKALEVLVEYEWLQREVRRTGGRPSECYLVNPAALVQAA